MKVPEVLCNLSVEVGQQIPFWIQGGGGNISYCRSNSDYPEMWIKASGLRLDKSGREKIAICLDFNFLEQELRNLLQQKTQLSASDLEKHYADVLAKLKDPSTGLRPSMETGFHVFLQKDFVIHFHSLTALLIAHQYQKNPQSVTAWFQSHFPDYKFCFLPYIQPGFQLALALAEQDQSHFYILQNHGVVLQDNEISILHVWKTVEENFLRNFGYLAASKWRNLSIKELTQGGSEFLTGPLKIYFPDTAVFYHELNALLGRDSSGRRSLSSKEAAAIIQNSDSKKLNLLEIWIATVLLSQLEPQLNSLPVEVVDSINLLPTEQVRKTHS